MQVPIRNETSLISFTLKQYTLSLHVSEASSGCKMTLFEFLKRIEALSFGLLTEPGSLELNELLKAYNIPSLTLNRLFSLRTVYKFSGLENKVFQSLKGKFQTFLHWKNQLQIFESKALQCMEGLIW